jgi:hypothetical protein
LRKQKAADFAIKYSLEIEGKNSDESWRFSNSKLNELQNEYNTETDPVKRQQLQDEMLGIQMAIGNN